MRVISKRILREFWEKHLDCEQQLKAWHREINLGNWKNLNELKSDFPKLSILNDSRVCFNIKGNNYRIIVKINFKYQMMWIRFVGTHSEYDEINANKI